MMENDDSVAMESSAQALVSLRGNQPSLRNSHGNDETQTDDVLLLSDNGMAQTSFGSPRRKARKPIKLQNTTVKGSPTKKTAMSLMSKLRNLLKLPKAFKWCYFEWFYSSIDKSLFLSDNDFCVCLKEHFPSLNAKNLRRVEWRELRRLMGKPRRCSQSFFSEERSALEDKRQKIRLLQQRKVTELAKFKDLPKEIPVPLVIGTKVSARLHKPQSGIFTGQIDAVDSTASTYRVQFDIPELGTHSVMDIDVQSNESEETMPMSAFALKERPKLANIPTFNSVRRKLSAVGDPLLSNSPTRVQLQDVLDKGDHTVGGFPIKFLALVTRLSKVLTLKREYVDKLKHLNSEAEKLKSYQLPMERDFQRKYAEVVLELERLNTDLNNYLKDVEEYCVNMNSIQGSDSLDQSDGLQKSCEKHAKSMVEHLSGDVDHDVENGSTLQLIASLSALLLQVKMLAESDLNSFEFKSLVDSVQELKKMVDSTNVSSFQNNVEIHIAHIQSGLSQMGNLQAFSTNPS
jgi:hypothetical protein